MHVTNYSCMEICFLSLFASEWQTRFREAHEACSSRRDTRTWTCCRRASDAVCCSTNAAREPIDPIPNALWTLIASLQIWTRLRLLFGLSCTVCPVADSQTMLRICRTERSWHSFEASDQLAQSVRTYLLIVPPSHLFLFDNLLKEHAFTWWSFMLVECQATIWT